MFATQIADLASLGLSIVAWRDLSTDGRVKMGESPSAIAIGWNWLVVDMVY